MSYFPFFIDIQGECALVVGGGRVALRKVSALLEFGALVKVVATELCQPLCEMSESRSGQLKLFRREFADADVEDVLFVVAATDNAKLNHHISVLCRERGILVNAVDQKEDCSFYFPAYVKRGEMVAGISSGGNSPMLAGRIRSSLEEQIPEYYGELNNQLGDIRARIKAEVASETGRRQCMEEVLARAQGRQGVLKGWEIEELLSKYRK